MSGKQTLDTPPIQSLDRGLADASPEEILAEYRQRLAEVLVDAGKGRKRYVACHDEKTGDPLLEDAIRRGDPSPLKAPAEQGRAIILTSGTTGTPKGATRGAPKGLGAAAALQLRDQPRAFRLKRAISGEQDGVVLPAALGHPRALALVGGEHRHGPDGDDEHGPERREQAGGEEQPAAHLGRPGHRGHRPPVPPQRPALSWARWSAA